MKKSLILPIILMSASPAYATIKEVPLTGHNYNQYMSMGSTTTSASESTCKSNVDTCWNETYGVCSKPLDNSYSAGTCNQLCEKRGKNAFVYSGTTKEWGCACLGSESKTEWSTDSKNRTGVLQQYKTTMNDNCTYNTTKIAQNVYKCKTGYYGSATSTTNNCKSCPTNATCTGASTFYCNNGYYRNSANNACLRCPDSKEGGLGWDNNGNGIAATQGDELIYCAIAAGTVLHDATGTFILDENESADGCEYTP